MSSLKVIFVFVSLSLLSVQAFSQTEYRKEVVPEGILLPEFGLFHSRSDQASFKDETGSLTKLAAARQGFDNRHVIGDANLEKTLLDLKLTWGIYDYWNLRGGIKYENISLKGDAQVASGIDTTDINVAGAAEAGAYADNFKDSDYSAINSVYLESVHRTYYANSGGFLLYYGLSLNPDDPKLENSAVTFTEMINHYYFFGFEFSIYDRQSPLEITSGLKFSSPQKTEGYDVSGNRVSFSGKPATFMFIRLSYESDAENAFWRWGFLYSYSSVSSLTANNESYDVGSVVNRIAFTLEYLHLKNITSTENTQPYAAEFSLFHTPEVLNHPVDTGISLGFKRYF